MEKWMLQSFELLLKLSFLGKKNPAVIPYSPQKCEVSGFESSSFHKVRPEKVGVSNALIYKMLEELEEEERANIHNLLILKDGELILECAAPGYNTRLWHLAHSMSKSVTGLAVGLLYDDKKLRLDQKVIDFFPEYTPKDKKFKKITLEHLLTMQSGIAFNEAGSVSESFWTRAFIESKVKFEPGTLFAYNSMNSYMLSNIVARVSGKPLLELVRERIFEPLKITNYYWEKSPEGIEKGGWGLYLSCQSFAKIGLMMLSGGVYDGKRILSEEWVKLSTSAKVKTPLQAGDFNYGYQIWRNREGDDFLFNGMLGQNVWMCPKNNIVAVMNAKNNEMFQKSPALKIIQKYLSGDLSCEEWGRVTYSELKNKEKTFFESRRWIHPRPLSHGIGYRLGLRSPTPFLHEWDFVTEKFAFPDNNQGILPLFIRAMQNNYTGGIESIEFERHYNALIMTVCEGGKDIRFEVGLYDYATSVLDFDGEKYVVRTLGTATKNEHGETIYKIELLFPEMPNSRNITMRRLPSGRVNVFLEEMPNQQIAEPFVESLYTTNPKLSFIIGIMEKRLGDKFVENKLRRTFAPVLSGISVESADYHRKLYALQDKNDRQNKTAESTANMLIGISERESEENEE
jgi:hypothetical protein